MWVRNTGSNIQAPKLWRNHRGENVHKIRQLELLGARKSAHEVAACDRVRREPFRVSPADLHSHSVRRRSRKRRPSVSAPAARRFCALRHRDPPVRHQKFIVQQLLATHLPTSNSRHHQYDFHSINPHTLSYLLCVRVKQQVVFCCFVRYIVILDFKWFSDKLDHN